MLGREEISGVDKYYKEGFRLLQLCMHTCILEIKQELPRHLLVGKISNSSLE